MSRQERTRALVAGCAGLALLAITFLPWFEFEQGGRAPDSATAWQSFGFIDLVLAAAVALSLITAGLFFARAQATSVAASSVTVAIGALGFLLVLYRLIDPPGGEDIGRELGAWLGLIATGAVVAGAYLGIQEE